MIGNELMASRFLRNFGHMLADIEIVEFMSEFFRSRIHVKKFITKSKIKCQIELNFTEYFTEKLENISKFTISFKQIK